MVLYFFFPSSSSVSFFSRRALLFFFFCFLLSCCFLVFVAFYFSSVVSYPHLVTVSCSYFYFSYFLSLLQTHGLFTLYFIIVRLSKYFSFFLIKPPLSLFLLSSSYCVFSILLFLYSSEFSYHFLFRLSFYFVFLYLSFISVGFPQFLSFFLSLFLSFSFDIFLLRLSFSFFFSSLCVPLFILSSFSVGFLSVYFSFLLLFPTLYLYDSQYFGLTTPWGHWLLMAPKIHLLYHCGIKKTFTNWGTRNSGKYTPKFIYHLVASSCREEEREYGNMIRPLLLYNYKQHILLRKNKRTQTLNFSWF